MDGDAVAFVRADVERVCAEFAHLAPAVRLRKLAELRAALDETLDQATATAMGDARAEGWGLRRIAAFSSVSHEQVRRTLAAASEGTTG
ncbi:hypothetical protein MRI28_17320 [Nocardiopsis dassonvillei]|uniref:hypothetical protein n=1 Tax=Nocardiopsis dassonvillei TaxID=2014 RepID=UPI00200C6294|nr:hypothetical protein [Nocardiopsis dassonvillei]MCK9871376.1 hypothetical protein [Nocardiopsis dassonvillei]